MADNALVLFVALVGAILSLLALFIIWRRWGDSLASDMLPRNVQIVIAQLRADYEDKIASTKQSFEAEMEDMRTHYEEAIARGNKRIAELERLVEYLTQQLLAAGGRPMPQIPQMKESDKQTIVVLGLWPVNADLNTRTEIDKIFSSGLQYVALDGNVSKRSVVSALERETPAIVHFGGHADADGTMFDDGVALTGWWSNIAQRFPFRLVVLNACTTLDIVDAMADAGVVAVVGMRGEIKDTVAIQFAGEFYSRLMRGQSVGDAVSLTKLTMEHADAELIAVRDPSGWTLHGNG